jgi:hypothetical protein
VYPGSKEPVQGCAGALDFRRLAARCSGTACHSAAGGNAAVALTCAPPSRGGPSGRRVRWTSVNAFAGRSRDFGTATAAAMTDLRAQPSAGSGFCRPYGRTSACPGPFGLMRAFCCARKIALAGAAVRHRAAPDSGVVALRRQQADLVPEPGEPVEQAFRRPPFQDEHPSGVPYLAGCSCCRCARARACRRVRHGTTSCGPEVTRGRRTLARRRRAR